MPAEERQQFVEKVWSPLETIAKHLAVERSRFTGHGKSDIAATRYQETLLDSKDEVKLFQLNNDSTGLNHKDNPETITVPSNHKSSIEEDYASTEKYELEAQKLVGTTTQSECEDCETTVITKETELKEKHSGDNLKDIDTVDGFKQFSDSVSKSN